MLNCFIDKTVLYFPETNKRLINKTLLIKLRYQLININCHIHNNKPQQVIRVKKICDFHLVLTIHLIHNC
jgi:hypothetical protein